MPWEPFPPESKGAQVWLEFIDDLDTTYFLLEGTVRSTKTYSSILAWADWVGNYAPPGPLMMLGNTRETLIQNAIHPLIDLVGPGEAVLNRGTGTLTLMGRPIYLFGAANITAMRRLQGKGAVGAYCDEATTYPYEVWQMLGTRVSKQGIKILATFNPDSPRHYMMTEYLNRLEEVNGRSWHFTLDDNPFMPESEKQKLKRRYTGLWYQRYIQGLWVMAEGVIYSMFNPSEMVVQGPLPAWSDMVVGLDYGAATVTAALAIGRASNGPHAGKWIAFKEYYNDAKRGAQKTTIELARDLQTFLSRPGGRWHPSSIEVDPSASALKIELKRMGFPFVHEADNRVKDGIMTVSAALTAGELLVHESCTHLQDEFSQYVWDPKAQLQGEDKPIKAQDHLMDCLRYACSRIFRRGVQAA